MKVLAKRLMYKILRGFSRFSWLGWHLRPTQTTSVESITSFSDLIRSSYFNTPLVRIGGSGDGGYLVPDFLTDISACFSPGVGGTLSFERELSSRGIKSFLADGTIEDFNTDDPNVIFERKNLGSATNSKEMTLRYWMDKCAPSGRDLLLQMDIEGWEYSVLSVSDASLLSRFRIMIIEFHNLDSLWDIQYFEIIRAVFNKILGEFNIVHVHPNNNQPFEFTRGFTIPPVVEISFLRKDICSGQRKTITIPHALDQSNNKGYVDSMGINNIFQP